MADSTTPPTAAPPPRRFPAGRLARLTRELTWEHAVGEVVLLVLGILIALTAQSWWQDREDRRTELLALSEMRAALDQDIADIRSDIDRYGNVDRATRALLRQVETGRPYTAALDTLFGDFLIFRVHLANSAAFESVKSRGLGLISDDSLRLAAVRFYGLTNASIALANDSDTRLVEDAVRPYYRDHLRMRFREKRRWATPLDPAAVLRDPHFEGLLTDRVASMMLTLPAYDAALAQALDLRARIDRQIERLGGR